MQANIKARHDTVEWWTALETRLTIEYSREVMEEIRAAACDGLHRLAHGGLEVGGVLFGERTDTSIRLVTWRSILCEHALGPSFRLSSSDRSELEHALDVAKNDPELRGLDAVGWFVSHARSGVFLTTTDLEIYNSFFPALWQVTLVLRPTDAGPARAGFFVREENANLHSDSSYKEFVIEPLAFVREPYQGEAAAMPPAAKHSVRDEKVSFHTEPKPDVPDIAERKLSPPRRPLIQERWFWAAILLLALLLAGVVFKDRFLSPAQSFPFRAYFAGDSVRIEWDSNSAVIRSARLAVLDIKDGDEKKRVALTDEQLLAGNMTFVRRSDDLEVRMIVFTGKQAGTQQFARVIGPPVRSEDSVKLQDTPQPSVASPAVDSIRLPARDQVDDQVQQLKQELAKQSVRADRLQEVVRILQNRIAVEQERNSASERMSR
jgi:proteasome lid subunit RPN8/RPN11